MRDFSEKVWKSQFVDWFPLFFDPFPHFLGTVLRIGCSWLPGFPSLVTPSSKAFRGYFIKSVKTASEVNLQKLWMVYFQRYGYGKKWIDWHFFTLFLFENLKLFLKTGNGPKNEETDRKKGNRSTNWEFKTFFWKQGTDLKKTWKPIKITGNESNVSTPKMDQNIRKSLNTFQFLRDFRIFLKKIGNGLKVTFGSVSVLRFGYFN